MIIEFKKISEKIIKKHKIPKSIDIWKSFDDYIYRLNNLIEVEHYCDIDYIECLASDFIVPSSFLSMNWITKKRPQLRKDATPKINAYLEFFIQKRKDYKEEDLTRILEQGERFIIQKALYDLHYECLELVDKKLKQKNP